MAVCFFVEIGWKLFSFKRLLEGVKKAAEAVDFPRPAVRLPQVEELCDIAERVFRNLPLSFTCLKKALIFQLLLARRGIKTDLKIGLTKQKDLLQAHAWLEQNGKLLFDPAEEGKRFSTVLSLTDQPRSSERGQP